MGGFAQAFETSVGRIEALLMAIEVLLVILEACAATLPTRDRFVLGGDDTTGKGSARSGVGLERVEQTGLGRIRAGLRIVEARLLIREVRAVDGGKAGTRRVQPGRLGAHQLVQLGLESGRVAPAGGRRGGRVVIADSSAQLEPSGTSR